MKSRHSISNRTITDRGEARLLFPNNAILYISLMSISVIFVAVTVAFVYNYFENPHQRFRLPLIFHINTLVIIASSILLNQGMVAMKKDQSTRFRNLLAATFILGTCFLAFQIVGWVQLSRNGITLIHSQSASYLYLVSGLHFFHVLAGVVALGYCFMRSVMRTYNPVADLMFVTDPVKKMRLRLVATYWHFVDGLWIYLYVLFLLMVL